MIICICNDITVSYVFVVNALSTEEGSRPVVSNLFSFVAHFLLHKSFDGGDVILN